MGFMNYDEERRTGTAPMTRFGNSMVNEAGKGLGNVGRKKKRKRR